MIKEEKKPVQKYQLVILRRDQNHIIITESDNFSEVMKVYNDLILKWSTSVKENIPFSISNPVVTTFDPGLIYEISVKPVVDTLGTDLDGNPYYKNMRKQGFQNTFGSQTVYSEITDGGYR